MKIKCIILALCICAATVYGESTKEKEQLRKELPNWTKDLVIYEINPYAFTSPKGYGEGNGSGTWNSLQAKIPYLAELGITGIWLAGFNDSTPHFYGIKTVYASKRPDILDPALGTREEFRAMIDEAHKHGIKIFLDVIMHGVLHESTLIKEHPDWFKGGSWGMTDYDFTNKEFRKWWVELWTNYILEDGVDGYRVDLGVRHPGLWDEICYNTKQGGHPIVVFGEFAPHHFGQHDRGNHDCGFIPSKDIAGDFKSEPRFFTQQISCHDQGWTSPPGNYYTLRGSRCDFGYSVVFSPYIPLFMSGEEFDAEQVGLPNLKQGLFGEGGPGGWMYGSWIQWDQLKEKRHKDMLADCQKILNIKKQNKDLLHSDRASTSITKVPYSSPNSNKNLIGKWNGKEWETIDKDAVSMAIDKNGKVWIVDAQGKIYTYDGQWTQIDGQARDIACGPDGSIWKTGVDESISKLSEKSWEPIAGGADRIDIDSNGNLWGVNGSRLIYCYDEEWKHIPGRAVDIICGADGSVWKMGMPGDALARWNGVEWEPTKIVSRKVAVDGNGHIWGIREDGTIFKYSNDSFSEIPGKASDIICGLDGVVWKILKGHSDCVPYARFLPGEKAIVVLGNDNPIFDVTFNLTIPLETMKMSGWGRYKVTDLWNNTSEMVNESDLARYQIDVPKDKIAGGGFRAMKIEKY